MRKFLKRSRREDLANDKISNVEQFSFSIGRVQMIKTGSLRLSACALTAAFAVPCTECAQFHLPSIHSHCASESARIMNP